MSDTKSSVTGDAAITSRLPDERHYRELRRKNVLRLFFTYLAPLIILTFYFRIQYLSLLRESSREHLKSVAEYQAKMLDLFLEERLVNLSNVVDDPKFHFPPGSIELQIYLSNLQKISDTFIDLGFFNETGVQASYTGPFTMLENKNYADEHWYVKLAEGPDNFIITDIYFGFRNRPHFTIAVRREINGKPAVLRATLDPEKFYHFITSLDGSEEVTTSIVNNAGEFQLVKEKIGAPLEKSLFVPDSSKNIGISQVDFNGNNIDYAYAWLTKASWSVIVQKSGASNYGFFAGAQWNIALASILIIVIIFLVIIFRAKSIVQLQKESDTTKIQLEHASKLASVGELAAGIAHEINNPLAIINERIGLMQDMMNPEFGMNPSFDDFNPHLESMKQAVFRGRDITRKLLSFVRKTDVEYHPIDVHKMIDDIISGFIEREMAVSNIEIIKDYGANIPQIMGDENQLDQVLLNFLNNAHDAIKPPGRIMISTEKRVDGVAISVTDTGCGIKPENMERIFLPFFTTKEVGKGTGLGLSVSYGIIKNMGGKIEVESAVGKGSVFTIILPCLG